MQVVKRFFAVYLDYVQLAFLKYEFEYHKLEFRGMVYTVKVDGGSRGHHSL